MTTAPVPLPPPAIGETIAIDQADGAVLTGTIATRRPRGLELWQLVVSQSDGRDSHVVTIARAEDGGWAVLDDAPIGAAIATARTIAAHHPLHQPVGVTLHTLAAAILALTGLTITSP